MDYRGIEIVCPVCKADLNEEKAGGNCLRCASASCGRQFPVVLGIPDLRVRPDPYIGMEADRAKGVQLAKRCAGLDFAGCVDLYYNMTPEVPPAQARQFKRGLLAAAARAEEAVTRWERESGEEQAVAGFLEIGCGTAPLLVAAARRFKRIAGIDIAFRWLVIARKRLAESGIDVPLICACAEALPFPGGAFDRVAADSVIENVWDQPAALSECHRVMRPGGWLFVFTPNRFSLGPDPHLGVWAGGYLPQRWVEAYARRMGAIPPRRRLLSLRSLRRLIADAGFAPPRIYLPDISAGQRARFGGPTAVLINLYLIASRLPVSRELLLRIGPLLHAVAQKAEPGVR